MIGKIPEYVAVVLKTMEAAGYEAWCVGGCVRDTFLERVPKDWDIATSALPEQTMALFPNHALPTGLQHGTVAVSIHHQTVEITTYRLDGSYHDCRRPDSVTFTHSLEEDLMRRDFTVNAIAMDLRGQLRDPFGGQEDLQNGILRCVGKADRRFQEDALRLLRGMRFAAALGFTIEQDTAAAIHRNRELLRRVTAERIQSELRKLLTGDKAADILRNYPDLIGVFWPEILSMMGFDQRNPHHCYDVWEHTLHALAATPSDPILRCAVLLHDIGKPLCFTIDEKGVGHFYGHAAVSRELADVMLRRLKCSNAFRETVMRLIEWHDRMISRTKRSVQRMLNILGEKDLRRLLAVKRADNQARAPQYRENNKSELDKTEQLLDELLAEDACFSMQQLAVSGRDMLALGLSGPEVGQALRRLLTAVVDGEVENDRNALLDFYHISSK